MIRSAAARLLMLAGVFTAIGVIPNASAQSPLEAGCHFSSIGRLVSPSEATQTETVGGVTVDSQSVGATTLVGAVAVCTTTPSATASIPPVVPPSGVAAGANTPDFVSDGEHLNCTLSGGTLAAPLTVGDNTDPNQRTTTATSLPSPYFVETTENLFALTTSVEPLTPPAPPPGVGPILQGSLGPGDYAMSCTISINYTSDETALPGGDPTCLTPNHALTCPTGEGGNVTETAESNFTVQ